MVGWTERAETCLNCWCSKVLKDHQQKVQLETSHCLTLGPILFSILFNDLDDGVECTLKKSAADSKLGVVVYTPVSCAAI